MKLDASVVYNKSDDEWDWNFGERAQLYPENNLTTPLSETGIETPGAYASVNYDTWVMNNLIDGYSDLSYEQYEFTLGATYNFTEAFYTKVQASYDIFESDEEYVYGDEDGDAFSGYVAIGYKF
ncbi:MAG: hypothetical protein JXR59_05380 [Desulfuromonadaceae bacterium]|nr:hypothetical protein [Desulfuromonadaceae bacterium]